MVAGRLKLAHHFNSRKPMIPDNYFTNNDDPRDEMLRAFIRAIGTIFAFMLILFFIRSLILLATTSMQYANRRRDGHGSLYTKYRDLLYGQEPSEAYADYLTAQMEAEAAKDVNLSRLLTKLGPVLGLIGTLISMSPALVGLSTGDISGMAYNMQVVFSATVVGLVISVVGLFTQQLKSRWHQQDISRLEYISSQYIEKHEKEA